MHETYNMDAMPIQNLFSVFCEAWRIPEASVDTKNPTPKSHMMKSVVTWGREKNTDESSFSIDSANTAKTICSRFALTSASSRLLRNDLILRTFPEVTLTLKSGLLRRNIFSSFPVRAKQQIYTVLR